MCAGYVAGVVERLFHLRGGIMQKRDQMKVHAVFSQVHIAVLHTFVARSEKGQRCIVSLDQIVFTAVWLVSVIPVDL